MIGILAACEDPVPGYPADDQMSAKREAAAKLHCGCSDEFAKRRVRSKNAGLIVECKDDAVMHMPYRQRAAGVCTAVWV